MENSDVTHVYLDYNATTPLEPTVVDTIKDTLCNAWKNPSSSYPEGKLAKSIIENARKYVGDMVKGQAREIIFLSGGTEANALVFHSIIEDMSAKHDSLKESKYHQPHILISNIEHDSITLTAEALGAKGSISLTTIPVSNRTGAVEVEEIMNSVRPDTRLISIMLANNETGVIQPIQELAQELKKCNKQRVLAGFQKILLHTDAAQAIGKVPVDVNELGVDYLTIVGHKFYAPRIGALWVRDLPNKDSVPLYPMFFGGGQEYGYRAGTENTAMIAGLGEASRLVIENIDLYSAHMKKIRDYLEQSLEEAFPNQVTFNSRFERMSRLPNTCNFSIKGENLQGFKVLKAAKVLQASVGAACHADKETKPSHILIASGIPKDIAKNALRLSVGRQTTIADIDAVVQDLKSTVLILASKC